MKELIFFWRDGCESSTNMMPIIKSIEDENPDIKVVKVDVENNLEMTRYYYSLYQITETPAMLGLVDGKLIDGHVGKASKFLTLSLLG